METNTTPTPADSLRSGLSDLGFEVSKPVVNTASTNGDGRGTSQTTDSTNTKASSNESAQTNKSSNASTSSSDNNSGENGESTDTTTQTNTKQDKQSRGQQRFQEFANDRKADRAEIDALKQQVAEFLKSKTPTEQAKVREIVPKPKSPVIPKDQLTATLNQINLKAEKGQATQEDVRIYNAAQAELAKWNSHDIDLKIWEIQNGQASKEQEGHKAWYNQKASEEYPALKDPNSEHSKLKESTLKRFEHVAKNLDTEGDYYAALVSGLVLKQKGHESEVGALKAEIEKLRKQTSTLSGKLEPVAEGEDPETTESPKSRPNETPSQSFRRKAREFRQANPLAFR